jgi:hypothetical protein
MIFPKESNIYKDNNSLSIITAIIGCPDFKLNLDNSNKIPDYIRLIYEIIENCTKTNISLNIPFLIYGGSKFEKELLIFWLQEL